jgi:feruloyl-CoA synthase
LERVRALAAGLDACAIVAGDVLLILARNGIDHALVSYAAMSLGAAAAPVTPQYGAPGADLGRLRNAVASLAPDAVYLDDAAAYADPEHWLGGAQLPVRAVRVISGRNPRPGQTPLADLEKGALVRTPEPWMTAKLLLTSGSTGRPKAVIQTHAAVATNAAQITACFDDPTRRWWSTPRPGATAWARTPSCTWSCTAAARCTSTPANRSPAASARPVRNLREVATTYHNMVPAGWAMLADELERDPELARVFFSRVRVLQYGGASMAQSVCDRIQAVALATVGERISFATGYGSTETGPTACNIHWPNFRTGMMGLPVPGTTLKLAPVGEKLEARVRGPQISPGYLGRPELTAAAFDEEGFYRLGDAARLAEDGRPEAGSSSTGASRRTSSWRRAPSSLPACCGPRPCPPARARSATPSCAARAGTASACCCSPTPAGAGPTAPPPSAPVWSGSMPAARGGSGRVARALIVEGQPDAASGELTDKGYINQALARERRAGDVERLYATPLAEGVIEFG